MIYITGDLHGSAGIERFFDGAFPDGLNLTKEDYVIITGDFSLVWRNNEKTEYWLNWLNGRPWTTLFIDGNHDNINLLNNYKIETWNGGKVHIIKSAIIHLMRGQVFNIEGHKFFTMGGAKSVYLNFCIEGVNWWSQEIPSAEEYAEAFVNLELNNWKVDCVLTHSAPTAVKEKMGFVDKEKDSLDEFLDTIYEKLEYKKWYFGHYHKFTNLDSRHTALYRRIMKLRM